MEERTERESDRRRREEKWQTCWCCRDQQRACRMAQASEEKPQCHSALVPQNAEVALAKRKRKRAVSPKHQIMRGERVKVNESRTVARKRGSKQEHGEGGLHHEGRQIPRRKGRASNKSLPRTSRRKHERVSGRKSSPGQSAESWFHS